MTPAERQAKLEAAKALMNEVEADEVAPTAPAPASTPAPATQTVTPTTRPPVTFPTKAQVAAQAQTPQAKAAAASIGLKPATAPALPASPAAPASGPKVDTVAAHASQTQPSVWNTLQKVAAIMKGHKS